MPDLLYTINKGINKPIEFKGLKAQYIWYLGGGVLVLLIVFAVLYIVGLNSFLCIGIIGLLGFGLFTWIYRLSRVHGEHGLMKLRAKRQVPPVVTCRSRQLFLKIK
jgi:Domain of unknown function (DUF4133)